MKKAGISDFPCRLSRVNNKESDCLADEETLETKVMKKRQDNALVVKYMLNVRVI